MKEAETKWHRLLPVAIDQIEDMLFRSNTPPRVRAQLIAMVLAYTSKEKKD